MSGDTVGASSWELQAPRYSRRARLISTGKRRDPEASRAGSARDGFRICASGQGGDLGWIRHDTRPDADQMSADAGRHLVSVAPISHTPYMVIRAPGVICEVTWLSSRERSRRRD